MCQTPATARHDLLRHTRESRAWDDRTHVSPDDGDVALVRGASAIHRAWEHRSRLRASEVTREQFDAFHATLSDATELLQRAADRLPGDPEPWALALVHARGLEAPPEVWSEYLDRLREADRWRYAGHRAAMELLTEKWFGSHDEMYDFADQVAAAAPAGQRVRTLPLTAVFEHMADDGPADAVARPGAPEAVDLAVEWLATSGDRGHHVVAEHRNTLVFVLFHLKRFRQAYDELVAVGPHATTRPWGYYGDPREVFLQYRKHVVVKTAEEM